MVRIAFFAQQVSILEKPPLGLDGDLFRVSAIAKLVGAV